MDLTSSVKAALLLSQSVYWTRHGRDIAQTGGWFHKTTEQWEWETGLSAKEQATAREVLRGLALLDDQRMGIPARLHFRLNVDELGMRLADRMRDVGLARTAPLPVMGVEGEVVRFLDELDLVGRQVGFQLRNELVDADGASSVRQQAAQGRRDVHGRAVGAGLVSQPDLRCAELTHEFRFRHQLLRRRRRHFRFFEDFHAHVAGCDLAQG